MKPTECPAKEKKSLREEKRKKKKEEREKNRTAVSLLNPKLKKLSQNLAFYTFPSFGS